MKINGIPVDPAFFLYKNGVRGSVNFNKCVSIMFVSKSMKTKILLTQNVDCRT